MKFLLIKIMMIISTTINFIKNPMSMGLILLMQTSITIIFMNLILNSSWFMMITFLMMVGGLLILIMYMTSIASNEKFKMNVNIILILILIILNMDEMIMDNLINENQNLMEDQKLSLSLMKIYNLKSMYVTLMLVIYLLLTMVSVSKTVKFFDGPLRMFSYE